MICKIRKLRIFFVSIFLIIPAFNLFSIDKENFSEPLSKNDVNPFDRMLMNPYSKGLDYTGTAFEALLLTSPALLFLPQIFPIDGQSKNEEVEGGLSDSLSAGDLFPLCDLWKLGLEYAETLLLAYGAKELAKNCVDRARPYMYFEGAPADKIEDGDWQNSFFSGHTTLSFAAATFTTFKFCQYFPDSVYKPYVIAASYSLAAVTAGLRLASGNHFMTDVLCGAAAGTLIGFFVPWINSFWFKPSIAKDKNKNNQGMLNESKLSFDLLPAGLLLTYRF